MPPMMLRMRSDTTILAFDIRRKAVRMRGRASASASAAPRNRHELYSRERANLFHTAAPKKRVRTRQPHDQIG